MRVALFATCLTDTFYPSTAKAVVRLLERLGCTVDFPPGQTCRGRPHFNTGYPEPATQHEPDRRGEPAHPGSVAA